MTKKEKPKTHFFITAVESKEDSYGHTRCWGYHESFQIAEKEVLKNFGDMHEMMYDYIVIEEHCMGILAFTTGFTKWYKWNEKQQKYKSTKIPEWAANICHWGIC